MFDFIIGFDKDEAVFIDVVSCYRHREGYRLVTGHKDWNEKLAYLEEEKDCKGGYLAFIDPQYHHTLRFFRHLVETHPNNEVTIRLPMPEDYHFLKISDGLPKSDISINSAWKRQLRDIETVCGVNFMLADRSKNEI